MTRAESVIMESSLLRRVVVQLMAVVWISSISPLTEVQAQLLGRFAGRGGEAWVGKPHGVVRLSLGNTEFGTDATAITSIRDANGRVLYPVFTSSGPLGVLRQRLGGDTDGLQGGPMSVYFLFQGEAPLEVTIDGIQTRTFRIKPREDARAHDRLLRQWWRHYTAAAERQIQQSDYPPLIESYLTTVLGWRFGLPDPLLGRLTERTRTRSSNSLMWLLNTEAIRQQTFEQALIGANRDTGPADLPVPTPIGWRDANLNVADVPVEAIAKHVPSNCFYLRFGNFANYLWMRGLLDEYGGDISRMVTARGHDSQANQRLQEQLGLKESVLAKILGGQVISDVAMIGRDTYLREGAAVGILFEARNALLKSDLTKQRQAAVDRQKENGATMDSVEIDGVEVSVASTPDNRLRSFYANVGRYHLVSTSRAVIEDFLSLRNGGQSLAETAEFKLARSELPLIRDDTVFAYLSPQFLQGLMSPQYQIELRRRMQAVNDLEILQIAIWVARLEGLDSSLESLVSERLIPASVLGRPDGSHPVIDEGRYCDSLRGARGTFTPIPDIAIEGVTRREADMFRQVAAFHATEWNQMDPLVVALQRFTLPDAKDVERLSIDARMLPFDREKYGLITSIVGPPSNTEIKKPVEDVINVQLVLRGGMLRPEVGPHLLFMGVQDASIPIDFGRSSVLKSLMVLQRLPAYLGSWPGLGFLDLIPLGTAPDQGGFSLLPLGLWRRQSVDGISLLSFDSKVLETTLPQLTRQQSEYPAQVRVRVDDLSQSKLRPWLEALNEQRAFQTSHANAELLHAITQQLGVPGDQAKQVAESILGVELVCALGGRYEFEKNETGRQQWVSSSWAGSNRQDSPAFQAPIMQWFRGMEADLVMLNDRVIACVQIDMKRNRQQAATPDQGEFPLFNLFRDNPFRSPDKIESQEEDPFEELPPPPPTPDPETLPEQ